MPNRAQLRSSQRMGGQKKKEIKEDREAGTKAIKHKGLSEERSETETWLFQTVCESDTGVPVGLRPSPALTCCGLLGMYGSMVDTWNMTS